MKYHADKEHREKHLAKSHEFHHQRRRDAHKILGGSCRVCGYDGLALQIDHINGGGFREQGYQTLSNVLKGNITNYQLLCSNCNWEKRYANKEFAGYMSDKED